ncbi:hypothetical protein T440DRAFT_525131 [Plenodomus tracheiphilus IPT5]|uniref:Uncharacterized protein n=1 Tax=Plenodomus tracheiphilus IPT5 TaxID=1408161 RepID=A0A6A7BBJ2_9PLEO|nr:hypothetical protein T440DRAFT_525131 [Plenodomus tracheiphilus IPT5]
MLGNSGGDSLITKLTSYLTNESVSSARPQLLPIINNGPDPPKSEADDDVHILSASGSTGYGRGGGTRQTLQRSISENSSMNRKQDEEIDPSSVALSTDGLQKVRDVHTTYYPSLKPPRPSAYRYASSPIVRHHNPYYDLSNATLQQTLREKTKFPSYQSSASTSPLPVQSARSILDESLSGPKRHAVTRSASYQDRKKTDTKSNSSDQPLKPCIKTKAKSTPTSPPGEPQSPKIEDGTQSLRRVKTVDFDENGSKQRVTLPTLVPTNPVGSFRDLKSHQQKINLGRSTAQKRSIYPIKFNASKGTPADPAVTRTDVHIFAIAPSPNAAGYSNEDGVDPATPTMQVVESKAGRHEVIWDNVSPERSIRSGERRSSSAEQALEKVTCHGKRGLDRVNTKLTDWSGTWNSPSSSFKPTIVVFPDDDTRTRQYDCAIDDDDDLTVLAPPNSQRTSAGPSRHQSRPASAPTTRMGSEEDEALEVVPQDLSPVSIDEWAAYPEESLVVPDPDGHAGRMSHTNRRKAQIPAIRKLSNIDDADLKFRGHRDSVTIAHSRLVRTGCASPELFAHRDSVAKARKRMHARNHATSAARNATRMEKLQPDALSLEDDGLPVVSLETVKEHALQALKKSSSASMLRTPEEPATQRHIKILE